MKNHLLFLIIVVVIEEQAFLEKEGLIFFSHLMLVIQNMTQPKMILQLLQKKLLPVCGAVVQKGEQDLLIQVIIIP